MQQAGIMNHTLHILLTIILGAVLEIYLPWWSVAISGFIVAIPFASRGIGAFWRGFVAVALLWGGYALFIGVSTDFILSTRIAAMLKIGSPYLLVAITAVLGGFIGGLSSLSGFYLKAAIR